MISVFLPTRKGSERVRSKNTRSFAGIEGGLLKIKLQQLLNCNEVDEVVLSTNDSASIEVASHFYSSKLKVVERPDNLALSSTSLVDLVNYVPGICTYPDILWTHVTSPFLVAEDYSSVIKNYYLQIENGYDSLMTVKPIRNFIWDKDSCDLINRNNSEKWPRTQDLKVFFEIDSAVFLTSKEQYLKNNDRIGVNPFLFELNTIKSFDVDWEEDFRIAEILYKGIYE
jgi:N-acylneuraminate cytidylyltransferase